jgi:hypothetical protein
MEKKLLNILSVLCIFFLPFLFTGSKVRENLVVFLSKGVLATLIDAYVVGTKRVSYPVRPFPKIFNTNIIYDFLAFPLLAVVWVKLSYNDKLPMILLKSLFFSVPFIVVQWFLEMNTRLFKFKKWSPLHTFASVNFTMFSIRGLVGLLKKIDKLQQNIKITNN